MLRLNEMNFTWSKWLKIPEQSTGFLPLRHKEHREALGKSLNPEE
jgi:hypothetical protein